MRKSIRTAIALVAIAWLIGVAVCTTRAKLPRTIRATQVPETRWERAMHGTAHLPISWTPQQGPPPLLPARGELLLRPEEAVLNGLAVIPGTNQTPRLAVTVRFRVEDYQRHRRLTGPLVPFLKDDRPEWLPPATGVDLCWGLDDPQAADHRGLRLRWDKLLAVYCADMEDPLFPGRAQSLSAGFGRSPSAIALVLDGNHVLASADGKLVFDFHTTRQPEGAVGIAAREGVITLLGIDVRVPEGPAT
ncbi:MAG: hypothetical protein FJX75_10640 [Armatimonadetes bacterium]|nr:hypothetical protein [Armatimonadota bacterium]